MNRINRGLFSSASEHWATPKALYEALDREFGFTDDPCPLHSDRDGLNRPWGRVTYCNPPYGAQITKWLKKGYEESLNGRTVVFLLPSRTDTKWWHDYVMKAHEICFLRGRLKFGEQTNNAPFPSAIVVFRGRRAEARPKRGDTMMRLCPRCGKVEVTGLIAGKPYCPHCGNETKSLKGSTPQQQRVQY